MTNKSTIAFRLILYAIANGKSHEQNSGRVRTAAIITEVLVALPLLETINAVA